jgi:hypothetical protein
VQQRKLTEKEFDKVTKLLSSAIKDKHQVRPEDLQRASVLFYSLNQLGFALVDLDVNAIIEKSGEYYSDTTKGLLARAANACYDLSRGMANPENEQFKLKEGF